MRIHLGRYQLIGDLVAAIPMLHFFEKNYPNSFKSWGVAKKVAQCSPCLLNHPLINQIFIFDGQEGPESQRDFDFIKSHDIIVNGCPQHPDNRYPKEFNIYSESWRMAGLPIEEWNKLTIEEQRPKLYKWWNPPKIERTNKKIIGLWGQAGYSAENTRNPSKEWWNKLLNLIKDDYEIFQFGAETDWPLDGVKRFNYLSFFDQIRYCNECDLTLGTDSGSSLIMAAYGVRQITLLNDHWDNKDNPLALAPDNPNNFNFFTTGSCDSIDINQVIQKIKEIC